MQSKWTTDVFPWLNDFSLRELVDNTSSKKVLRGNDVILPAERKKIFLGMGCGITATLFFFFLSYIYSLLKHNDPFVILIFLILSPDKSQESEDC